MKKAREVRTVVAVAAAGLMLAAFGLPAEGQSPEELVARGVGAGADAALLGELRARAERAGADEAVTARLLRPAVELAERGLPSEAVLQRGLEGLAKRVPPERVATVIADLGAAVPAAARVVDPWMARPDVRARLEAGDGRRGPPEAARRVLVERAAVALTRDVPETALSGFLERVPDGVARERLPALELGVALEVLGDLPVTARDHALGARVLVAALDAGFEASELRELPDALRMAERRGELPAEAVARGAAAQMAELPAATVLQNLFQGNFPGNVPFEVPPGLERARERGAGGPP